MNLTLTRSAPLPLGFAAAVVLSSVLLSTAASLVLTARHEPVPAPTALAPVSPVPPRDTGDTGVPDAATALHAVHEPVTEPAPSF